MRVEFLMYCTVIICNGWERRSPKKPAKPMPRPLVFDHHEKDVSNTMAHDEGSRIDTP